MHDQEGDPQDSEQWPSLYPAYRGEIQTFMCTQSSKILKFCKMDTNIQLKFLIQGVHLSHKGTLVHKICNFTLLWCLKIFILSYDIPNLRLN